jgi:peptide/nickel transport system ATP-binding protein
MSDRSDAALAPTAEGATGAEPAAGGAATILEVRGLFKRFPVKTDLIGRTTASVSAVDGVDFELREGETLGVVGESGCGKSTLARLLMHLVDPTAGTIRFAGQEVGSAAMPWKTFREQVQMVFQDSYASLNPRLTVVESIAFGARVHGVGRREAESRACALLDRVGLDPVRFGGRFPHELSGGQRQRVNIARALGVRPRVLVLDEAVSALDKSVEAQVLNLLLDLKDEFRLTYLFISHDLEVVRFMASRVLVMYLGRVAELGPTEALYTGSRHPYTTALLGSMLSMDPDRRTDAAPISGDPPNPIDPPSGCRFHTRCPYAEPVCSSAQPLPTAVGPGHAVACHRAVAGSGHSHAGGAA